MPADPPTLAVSSWSVHRAIGVSYPNAPGSDGPAGPEPTWGPGAMPLVDVPAALARLGITRMESVRSTSPGMTRFSRPSCALPSPTPA